MTHVSTDHSRSSRVREKLYPLASRAIPDYWSFFQTRTYSPLHEVDWPRPEGTGYDDSTSDGSVSQDFWKVLVPARCGCNPTISHHESYLVSGTVVSEIAKSRADIEGARLLVLSAALQIDRHQAKGAMKEIGIAKVCGLRLGTVRDDRIKVH